LVPPRYLVLAGGLSHERDVSLRSGRRVLDALRAGGVDVDLRDADASLLDALADTEYAAVFVALHGGAGEDGALREVLDVAGVPYVGSPPAACRIAWDKPTAKALAGRARLSTPASVVLPHAAFRELGAGAVLDRLVGHLGLPLMVKPARGGSALGCTRVDKPDELPAAMVSCFSYGEAAMVERFVSGTYTARYTAGHTEFFTPARLSDERAAAVAETAVTAHRILGLRDLSRVDLVVDGDGVVQLLEVNTAPGMTETSLLPMAVQAAGLSFGGLLHQLLEQAAARSSGSQPGS
jgi:D-alanine-D-alanine ligase